MDEKSNNDCPNKIPRFAGLASVLGIAAYARLITDTMETQAKCAQELAWLAEATGRTTDDILADFEVFPGTWEQFVLQLLNPEIGPYDYETEDS